MRPKVKKIRRLTIGEIAVVDRPANPGAMVHLTKREDTTMRIEKMTRDQAWAAMEARSGVACHGRRGRTRSIKRTLYGLMVRRLTGAKGSAARCAGMESPQMAFVLRDDALTNATRGRPRRRIESSRFGLLTKRLQVESCPSHAVFQSLQTWRHEKCTKSKSCPRFEPAASSSPKPTIARDRGHGLSITGGPPLECARAAPQPGLGRPLSRSGCGGGRRPRSRVLAPPGRKR
jgi:hypothetical protein